MNRFILLLLLCPCITHAQKWRIGLSGGVSIITKPKQGPPVYDGSKMRLGGVGMLSIVRRIAPHLDLGLDVTAANLVRKNDLVISNGGASSGMGVYSDARLHVGKMAFIITPSLSFQLRHFYLGPQAGYFITAKGTNNLEFPPKGYLHYYFNDVRGFVAGAHAGYVRSLPLVHLSLFGELRANYLDGNQVSDGVSWWGFKMLQIQLTAGLSYAL